jgi:myo-inositol-1-phosphate synthase
MREIRVAVAGVGNCASSLIQGLQYYSKKGRDTIGLMHYEICGYKPGNIKVVAAFDIDGRKVGKPLEEAIFSPPNCTKIIESDILPSNVKVSMGHVFDGVSPHMKDYPAERIFLVSKDKPVDVVKTLKETDAEIFINYLPVGSEKAAGFYARCCLESGVSLINCIPVFIASNIEWAKKFRQKRIPVIGDDVKSQIGATIIPR